MTTADMKQNGRILATVGGVVFLIAAGLIIFAVLMGSSKAETFATFGPAAIDTVETSRRTTTTTTRTQPQQHQAAPAVAARPAPPAAAAAVAQHQQQASSTSTSSSTSDKIAAAHQALEAPEARATHWGKLKQLLDAYASAHPNDQGVQAIAECLRDGRHCDDEAYSKFEDLDHGLIQHGKKRLERAIQNLVRTDCLREPEGKDQHLCIAMQRYVGHAPALHANSEHEYAVLVQQSQKDRSASIRAAPSGESSGTITYM